MWYHRHLHNALATMILGEAEDREGLGEGDTNEYQIANMQLGMQSNITACAPKT